MSPDLLVVLHSPVDLVALHEVIDSEEPSFMFRVEPLFFPVAGDPIEPTEIPPVEPGLPPLVIVPEDPPVRLLDAAVVLTDGPGMPSTVEPLASPSVSALWEPPAIPPVVSVGNPW